MTWREKSSKDWLVQRNAILKYMKRSYYKCDTEKLHSELKTVFREKKDTQIAQQFGEKKTLYYSLKFILFVALSALKLNHYYIMGLLWYRTFLFEKDFVKEVLGSEKKNLLDIWAGSGTITENFEDFVEKIYCQEPSHSFQKILKKRWYTIVKEQSTEKYEVITLFNVIDVCSHPEKIIESAKKHSDKNSIIIISLPFPVCAQSWDNKNIRKTNQLSQPKEMNFEEAVSDFYVHFLKKHTLRVNYFTRLPYIVSLPETQKTAIYDNGLFVCKLLP